MRSPAFLEAMQRNLKAMTDLKSMQDQVVQDMARHVGVPLASDIHGLFERLHSVEQTILRPAQGDRGASRRDRDQARLRNQAVQSALLTDSLT